MDAEHISSYGNIYGAGGQGSKKQEVRRKKKAAADSGAKKNSTKENLPTGKRTMKLRPDPPHTRS